MSSSSAGIQHPVYCLEKDSNSSDADSKPPLLLLHELNGLTPQTLRYAAELSQDFTVYLPMMFGEKGKTSFLNRKGLWAYWDWFGSEWSVPSKGSSPIVNWLRDVVSDIEQKHKSSPIRIIGNCMTGALPLGLLGKADGTDNANIDAVVLAQPALPMRFWWWHTEDDYKSLGLSNDDLMAAQKSKAKILALRFQTDWISHPGKRETLRSSELGFGDRLSVAEICARDYDPEGKKLRPHSTLIGEYDAVGKVGELSKRTRETVRNFLLHPTNTVVGNSECSSKVNAGSTLDSAR
ncbi:MAG: hypothetical protein H8K04_00305 [Nitrospira sp.]